MEAQPEQHQVFVSFAEQDRPLADRVSESLRRDGVRVRHSVDSGESGSRHLMQLRALRDSKVAIFLVTEASARSPTCLAEAQAVADPGQISAVPIPLVVGAWSHEASELWRLLSKWNSVIARPTLSEDALYRLTDLVHAALGSLFPSTKEALFAAKDDLTQYLRAGGQRTGEEILAHAQQLQIEHGGDAVAFSQLTRLDREVLAAELLPASGRTPYLRRYLEAFFGTVVAAGHNGVATRLASQITTGDVIVISGHSRVIRHAIQIVSDNDHRLLRSLRFLVVARTGMLRAADEPSRMEAELRALGAEPQVVPVSVWIEYLMHQSDGLSIGHVSKILFGVEAFSRSGDVVFPQIVNELDLLRARLTGTAPISDALVIAAGESFKVCRDEREVSKMAAAAGYTVMPADAFDLVVTDIGKFTAGPGRRFNLDRCVEHVDREADKLRESLWPARIPLPVWNLRERVWRRVTTVVSDVDGTLTDGQELSLNVLDRFQALAERGIRVILVTGRAAGWGAALDHYLPGVSAVIAENGAVLIDRHARDSAPILLDGWSEAEHQDALDAVTRCLTAVRERFPQITVSADNFTRLTDRTFLTDDELDPTAIGAIVRSCGLRHTYSTVHHHISASRLDKESGLRVALRDHLRLDIVPEEHVIAVGDSFNDAPLFRKQRFASSVGVRSVLGHLSALGADIPGYVTLTDGGAGFVELADILMQAPPPAG